MIKKTIKVKYVGNYTGVNPTTGLTFTPGEVRELPLETAEVLVESGQFEIQNKKPIGGE